MNILFAPQGRDRQNGFSPFGIFVAEGQKVYGESVSPDSP
jgi:hypothetical protein